MMREIRTRASLVAATLVLPPSASARHAAPSAPAAAGEPPSAPTRSRLQWRLAAALRPAPLPATGRRDDTFSPAAARCRQVRLCRSLGFSRSQGECCWASLGLWVGEKNE